MVHNLLSYTLLLLRILGALCEADPGLATAPRSDPPHHHRVDEAFTRDLMQWTRLFPVRLQ